MTYGSESVVKVATGEWVPFMSQNLIHYGLISQIVTEAFAQEGVNAKYTFYPWSRAMVHVEKGLEDASSAWYWSEERAKTFLFSDPVFVEQQVLFHRKDNPVKWSDMEDLRGKRIGATIGYFYGEAFQQAENAQLFHVERVSTDEQNFKKLVFGRVDVVVASRFVGQALIKSLFPPEETATITYHPRPVNEGPLHLIVKINAKGQEWMDVFNRGLANLKASGQYDQILRHAIEGGDTR